MSSIFVNTVLLPPLLFRFYDDSVNYQFKLHSLTLAIDLSTGSH